MSKITLLINPQPEECSLGGSIGFLRDVKVMRCFFLAHQLSVFNHGQCESVTSVYLSLIKIKKGKNLRFEIMEMHYKWGCKSIKKNQIRVFHSKMPTESSISRLEDSESEYGKNILCRCVPFSRFVKDSHPKTVETNFGFSCSAKIFAACSAIIARIDENCHIYIFLLFIYFKFLQQTI